MSSSVARVASLALLLGPLAACGDDSVAGTGGGGGSSSSAGGTTGSTTGSASTGPGSGGGGGATTSSSSTGTGGQGGSGPPAFGDDCATSEDCFGAACVEVNGHRTCRAEVEQATECTDPSLDECCDSTECVGPDEICTLMPDVYCGGPAPVYANQCVSTDATCLQLDCGKSDAACAPPGVFGFREARCLPRSCQADEDCADGSGGSCVPVADPCCNGVVGYFCTYTGGCRDNTDCGAGEYCEVDFETGTASCVEGVPACPA